MKWKQWVTVLCTIFTVILFTLPAMGGDINIAVGDETGKKATKTSLYKSYSVKILNSSSEKINSISLKVLKAPEGINVVDGSVLVSAVDANNYVITEDGFTISVKKGTWSSGKVVILKWLLDYSDSAGTHQQVTETISSF